MFTFFISTLCFKCEGFCACNLVVVKHFYLFKVSNNNNKVKTTSLWSKMLIDGLYDHTFNTK